jgi:hydroxyacylglutathione hydrolase
VLLRTIEAPLLGATCNLLVDGSGHVAVVDAGGGVAGRVLRLVEERGWVPAAVLATHGHVDHTWDAGTLCRAWDVPLHVHEADAYRLADPFGTLGPLGPQLRDMAGLAAPVDPPRVATFALAPGETAPLDLGLDETVEALHLPGHTEGSTAYLVDVEDASTVLTGDVLFAGTIGRTDLPGGDDAAMAESLRRLAALPEPTEVVPGHGPRSTIGAELRTNPYLRSAR